MAEVFRRLERMPAAASGEEGRANLENVLDKVEDELSGVLKDPSRWQSDGRMYMPEADSQVNAPTGVQKFRSRGHYVLFGSNGAIEIQDLKGKTVHERSGADGRGVLS